VGEFTDFLKNENKNKAAAVPTPAFSITKVVAIFAPLLTGLATAVAAAFEEITFTASQVTLLVVGLFAFLAITCAADVLARGRVESAKTSAEGAVAAARAAAQAGPAYPQEFIRFSSPLAASVGRNGHRAGGIKFEDVKIVAASGGKFLCLRDADRLSWEPANRITFKN
jgi:hypothetical protein